MAHRVSATDLARRLGDILGRIRYRGETFTIDRHSVAIAQIGPPSENRSTTLREAAKHWIAATDADPGFADDLERIGAADTPPTI
jgi:hypothetical protein